MGCSTTQLVNVCNVYNNLLFKVEVLPLFPLSLITNQKGESAPSVSEGSRWVSGFLDGVCGVFSWGNMQMVLLDLMNIRSGITYSMFLIVNINRFCDSDTS